VELTVYRNGAARELTVELGQLDAPTAIARSSPAGGDDAGTAVGLSLRDLSQADREQLGLDAAVNGAIVVGVEDGSLAAQQGIVPGDVIVQINQEPIASAQDARAALADSRADGRRALLLVRRGDAQRFVALNFA
jgi:serine protease Do